MTIRAIAGVFDRRRPPSDDDVSRLAAAISEGNGPVRTVRRGPLAVAWAGSGPAAEAEGRTPLVILDGVVFAIAGESERGTRPDAAHLAALFERDVDAVIPRLRGDYVLVIADTERERCTLVRDHLGSRGLVWHESGGRVRFASEVRHLLPSLDHRPGPDDAAIVHWLALSAGPDDRTPYRGIRRLLAGHRLDLGGGRLDPVRYWTPVYHRPSPGTIADHAGPLLEAMTTAVRRRTDGASTTGVLLSGGLDSTSVAGVGATLGPELRPARAYSATFPDHDSIDESALIAETCQKLGLASTAAVVRSGSVIAGAFDYIATWLVPPTSPNLFFWFPLLRRAAADGTTVLLDGEGGDEVFGASTNLIADRLRRGRIRSASALVRALPGGGDHVTSKTVRTLLYKLGVKPATPPLVYQTIRRIRGAARYSPSWLLPEAAKLFMETDQHISWKDIDGPLWFARFVDLVTRGHGTAYGHDHIRRRGAMCDLESRHPLVDVDLIDRVLSVPPELAYEPRFSRPIMRAAVDGLVPESVRLRRTKSHFDAIFHDALAGPDLEVARTLLRPGEAAVGAWVDLEAVGRRLLATPPPAGHRVQWGMEVWRLMNTELWLRAQTDGGLDEVRRTVRFSPAELDLVAG